MQITCDGNASGAEIATYRAYGPRAGQTLYLCDHDAAEFAKVMPAGWSVITLDNERIAGQQVVIEAENYVTTLADLIDQENRPRPFFASDTDEDYYGDYYGSN